MLNIFNKIFYKELCISKVSWLDSKYFFLFQCFHHILFIYLFNLNLCIVWFFFWIDENLDVQKLQNST